MNTPTTSGIDRAPLTPDPYLLNAAPLRNLKPPRRREQACGLDACAITPPCTSRCRVQQADEALHSHYSTRHSQRADMPPVTPTAQPTSNNIERRITWWLLIAWCVGCLGYGIWLAWSAFS